MKSKFIALLQIVLFFWTSALLGNEKEVFLKITAPHLTAKNGSLVSTSLKLVNESEEVFRGKLVFSVDESLEIVGAPSELIMIRPNENRFIPIKALVGQTARAGDAYQINARLFDAKGQLISWGIISVTISETQKMQLYVPDRQVVIEEKGGIFEIDAQLYNAGNTEQNIVLLAKLPHEIQGDFQRKHAVTVRPFQDTTVTISIKTTRRVLAFDDFNVHITGLYEKGEVFGRETVRVTAIKTSRKYRPSGAPLFPVQKNQLYLRAQDPNEENSVYEARLNAEFQLPNKATMRLNLDGTYRKNIDELYFRNSWIGYDSERYGGKLGNIYKNYSVYLNGRGGELYWKSKNQKNRFEVGALEKSYRLFQSSPVSQGNSFWAAYRFDVNKHFLNANFIYDEDLYRNHQNMVFLVDGSLINRTNLKIAGGISGGSTAPHSGTGDKKYGMAGEVNLSTQVGNLSFVSNNFMSTAYYPGEKRGAMNFDERISLRGENYSYWAVFNHYGFHPKYVLTTQGRENKFSMTRAEIGVSRKIGTVLLSFGPQYSIEQRRLLYADHELEAKLSAFRLNSGLAYSHLFRAISFNLDVETGVSEMDHTNDFQFQARFSSNWGKFRLYAYYQLGNFYLGEAVSNQQNDETYYRWQVSPNFHFDFLNDKLDIYLGTTYAHNTNSGTNLQLFARANYEIMHGLELFAGTEHYDYSYADYSDQRIEFGIIKNFATPKLGVQSNDLEVFVYQEHDGVQGFSGTDQIALQQVVYLNGKAFKTNANGEVLYRKIPVGNYSVRFDNFSKWYAKDREVEVKDDTRIEIGLEKMTTLKGSVHYTSTVLSYDINKKKEGLNIVAVDASGKNYSTKTFKDGSFVMYLPKGAYTVSLIAPGMMKYIEVKNDQQQVLMSPGNISEINFEVIVKEQQVEYKKFSSN